jgi:DNA-directed RNA polymerase sigma subunit (sigma70/sigma32)
LQDLLSEGLKGLNIAVERFDPTLGVKFSTYAHWWIQQAVKLAHKELSHTVRLPTNVQALYVRACRFRAEFYRAHGRQAFDDEVAAGLGISPKRLKDVCTAHTASLSIDAPGNAENGDVPLSSLLAVRSSALPQKGL